MSPFLAAAALAVGGYFLLREHQFKGTPSLPVPPPSPDGGPPKDATELPGASLIVSLEGVQNIGDLARVFWTTNEGEAGGSAMPIAWVSPDRTRAVVRWNETAGTSTFGAKFGRLYFAEVTTSSLA